MKFGHFIDFLPKTRIILTTEPEFSAIPHPTPSDAHNTCSRYSPLVPPHAFLWEKLLAAGSSIFCGHCHVDGPSSPFKKVLWPSVLGRHIPASPVRKARAECTLLSIRTGMCCLFPTHSFLFAAFALELH